MQKLHGLEDDLKARRYMSPSITHGIFESSCLIAFREYSGDPIGPTWEKIKKNASAFPPRTQDLIKKNLIRAPRANHWASTPVCSPLKLSFTYSNLPVVPIATKMGKQLNGEPNYGKRVSMNLLHTDTEWKHREERAKKKNKLQVPRVQRCVLVRVVG